MKKKTNKKMSKKALGLTLCGIVTLACAGVVAFVPVTYKVDNSLIQKNPDYNVVKVEKDGYQALAKVDANGNYTNDTFKVMGVTDFHLDSYKQCGAYTINTFIKNVVTEKPDLIVMVGDNITSNFNYRRAHQLAKVMEGLGVYWTFVLGNHEGIEFSLSRKDQVNLFSDYEHCLVESEDKYTSSGDLVWGYGNHVINLLNKDGKAYESLFFIDGGSEMSKEDLVKYNITSDKTHYDFVKESQIDWYKETVLDIKLKEGKTVESTIFDHIALPEYVDAYKELGGDVNQLPTSTINLKLTTYLGGEMREGVCCSEYNSGLFETMQELGSTNLFVCGHDHVNDFAILYRGITLMYNRKSGYSSYQMVSKSKSRDADLLEGYTIYSYSDSLLLPSFKGFEHKTNSDIYPEEQDAIREVVKLDSKHQAK